MENTSPATNPLLDLAQLPRFGAILPEHVGPALDQVLAENRHALESLLMPGGACTWSSFAQPIEDMRERLSRVWSPVSHMHAVMDSEPLRAAYNAVLPKITNYFTELADTFGEPASDLISLKVLYYLDYQYLKRKSKN